MANYISKVTLPDTNEYDIKAKALSNRTASSALTGTGTVGQYTNSKYYPAKWTFNSGADAVNGDIVTIKLPCAGHDYGVFMSVDNGTHYYPVVVSGTGRVTTHYPSGGYITVIFNSSGSAANMFALAGQTSSTRITVSGGVWQVLNYYDSGNSGLYQNYNAKSYKVGTTAITAYDLIAEDINGYLVPAHKIAHRVGSPIFIRDGALAANATGSWASIYDRHYNLTIRKDGNNLSLTTYAPVFLKGSISGGIFTPDTTTPYVSTKANCNVSGAYYMYIGDATGGTTISFNNNHPYYYYDGTNLVLYSEYASVANNVAWTNVSNRPTKLTLTGSVTGSVNLSNGELSLDTTTNHNHNASYVTAVGYDSTNKKIYYTKNGSNTDVVTFGSNAFNSTSYLPLAGGTMTGHLKFSGNDSRDLTWEDGTWYQRILVTDDSTSDTAVFTFQQTSNSGTSWTDLLTIKDNGTLITPGSIQIGNTGARSISYKGTKATYSMIKFIDNTSDNYGNGISIGGGGLVIVGAGESSDAIASGKTGGDEVLYLGSDGAAYLYTNVQSGLASAKTFTFGTDGILTATGFSGSGASLTSLNASNISSGTLNLARLGNQNKNLILAGPTTGDAAAPSFRAMVEADLPYTYFRDRGSIAANKDLNDYTTNGTYFNATGNNNNTNTGFKHTYGYIIALGKYSNNYQGIQIEINTTGKEIWYRTNWYVNDTGNVWYDKYKILTTANTITTAQGGTGQSSYTIGDILYASDATTLSKLGGNTTKTRKFLRSVATTAGTAVAPAWDTLTADDIPSITKSKISDFSHTHGNITNGGLLGTANRIVWTDGDKKVYAGYHYANSTKIAINSSSEPTENLYVSGTIQFNLGTANTSSNNRKFIVLGADSNKMSIAPTGLQVYNSSNNATTLYFQAYGGNIIFGSSSYATATRDMYGTFDFKSTNGFTYSGIGTGSDNVARPVWFSYNGITGRPVYDNDFKYNPSTNTLTIGTGTLTATNYSGTAAKATADASGNTITTTYATNTKVDGLLAAADAMIFKGTLGTGGTITALPATHNAGDTYRVITAGTWAGKYCEVGTLIICVKDGTAAADADWTSVETNEDGAVIGPAGTNSSTDNAIARWDSTSGRIIQNSKITIDDNGNLLISHAASATMTADSTNPKITFAENGTQPVHLIYTDYDAYRNPAGLKIIGGTSATPAWLEVEGNIYAAAFKGNADTATKLTASKTLWGQSFDGSANVTGSMTNVGPNMKLPADYTEFDFYTSNSGAANAKFGKLGLNGTYANIDISNYTLDVGGKTRISDYIYRVYSANGSSPVIWMNGADYDNWLWKISAGTTNDMYFGYGLKYIGSGSGVANYLRLYADAQNGTEIIAIGLNQSGQVGIGADASTSYRLNVNGTTYLGGNTTLEGSSTISRAGKSINWNAASTYAPFRMTSKAGWSPLWALKSTSGWWTMGHYDASGFSDHLLFTLLADVDVAGVSNAKNHMDYTVRLIPTIYATNTNTTTDRAFVTAPWASSKAAVGSTKKPVYINDDGVATEISYTIEKSVPSNAVFTDHYTWGDITSKPTSIALTGAVTATATTLGDGAISITTTVNHGHGHISSTGQITQTHQIANGDRLIVTDSANTTAADKNKLIATSITFDASTENKVLSKKGTWVDMYTHPTDAGNNHIPSGGSTGQFLKYGDASGKATWSALPTASTSGAGIIQIGTGASNAMAGNTNVNNVTQGTTTTGDWRKVILSGGNTYAAYSTAVSDRTNQVYQAVGIAAQPSTGTLRATILQGGSIILTGANIQFAGTKATTSMITFLDNTADANGNGIKIGGGGVTVIGSGEAAGNFSPATAGTEILYLLSDQQIYLETNGQTIGNRVGVCINNSNELIPVKAETATNNYGSIGTSSYKWANIYATTFYGALSGNATTATSATTVSYTYSTLDITQDNLGITDNTERNAWWIGEKNGNGLGRLNFIAYTNGKKSIRLQVRPSKLNDSNQRISGSFQGISITGNLDNTISYTIDNAENFRSALGLGTAATHAHGDYRSNTAPASGTWFRGTPAIGSDGVMEIGKYIDFHATNTTTADYDARIEAYVENSVKGLKLSGTTKGTFSGNLTGNVTGNVSGDAGGNAATATKLKTAVSLWGNSFDGSASIAGDLDWNSDTYRQRIHITDDNTANTAVFTFQQSTDSGSTYPDLFTIYDNKDVKAWRTIYSEHSIWGGSYTKNTAQSAEHDVGVQGGAGKIYFWSTAAVNGSRGIYLINANESTSSALMTVNQSNQITAFATIACKVNISYANTATSTPMMLLTDGATATVAASGKWMWGISHVVSNLAAGGNTCFITGKANGTNNSAVFGFHYADNNSDNNYADISLYGNNGLLKVYKTGKVEITKNITSSSTTTGSLVVAGGTGIAGALYAGGNIYTMGNVTIGSNVTLQWNATDQSLDFVFA